MDLLPKMSGKIDNSDSAESSMRSQRSQVTHSGFLNFLTEFRELRPDLWGKEAISFAVNIWHTLQPPERNVFTAQVS